MLTDRQQQIWNYLVEYVDGHGYPPTVREIGEEVGLASPSTVHAHLANLERAGLLRRDPTKPRALELIGRERAAEAVRPGRGGRARRRRACRSSARSPPARPLLAEQNIEEYLTFPSSTGGDFLLRVRGDSMIEAGILDGDLVIVQQAQEARNGEIVVALAGRGRVGRRGDGQDVLPRGRPHPAAAGELGAGADLRRLRPDPRAASSGSSVSSERCNLASRSRGRSTRSWPHCCAAPRSSASSAASS